MDCPLSPHHVRKHEEHIRPLISIVYLNPTGQIAVVASRSSSDSVYIGPALAPRHRRTIL